MNDYRCYIWRPFVNLPEYDGVRDIRILSREVVFCLILPIEELGHRGS